MRILFNSKHNRVNTMLSVPFVYVILKKVKMHGRLHVVIYTTQNAYRVGATPTLTAQYAVKISSKNSNKKKHNRLQNKLFSQIQQTSGNRFYDENKQ